MNSTNRSLRFGRTALITGLLTLGLSNGTRLLGDTYNWDPLIGDNFWGNFLNWDPTSFLQVPDSNSDTAIFTIEGSDNETVLLLGFPLPPYTVENLTIVQDNPSATGSFSFRGGFLQLESSDPLLPAQINYESSGNTFEGFATITSLVSDTVFNAADDSDLTYKDFASITGAGKLIKEGEGDLVMENLVNSYSGGTEINEGTLSIASDSHLGDSAGTLTLDGGTLRTRESFTTSRDTVIDNGGGTFRTNNNTILSHDGSISGTGELIKTGGGTLTLSGNNSYTGGTKIKNGVLRVSEDGNLGDSSGNLTINDARLRVTGTFSTDRTTNLRGPGGEISVKNGETLTHDGTVQGTGALTKLGNGTLELLQANTYSGGTLLSKGTLVVGNNNALGTGPLLIQDGTTLATPAAFFPFTSYTLNNDIFVQGDFNVSPNGQTVLLSALNLNGSIQLSGETRTITNTTETGPVRFGGVISNGGLSLQTDPFSPSAYFTFNGSQANTYTGETTVGEYVTLTLNKDDHVTAIAGDVTIEEGALLVTAGEEQIADDANIHFEDIADLRIGLLTNVTETIGSISDDNSGWGMITLNGLVNGSTLRVESGTFTGDITGGGVNSVSLEKYGAGTLTLEGYNDYRGDTSITGGVLEVSEDENLGSTGGWITDPSRLLFDGGTLSTLASFETERDTVLESGGGTFRTKNNSVLTHSGSISGDGALVKRGNGVLVLEGDNSYADGTEIYNGTVRVSSDSNLGDASGDLLLKGGKLRVIDDMATARTTRLRGTGGEFSIKNGYTLTHSGLIRGQGALSKLGQGTLKLNAANSYQGGTVIENGQVIVANSQAMGTGPLDFRDGTLSLEVGLNLGGDFTWSGGTIDSLIGTNTSVIDVSGSLDLTGTGEFLFTPDGGFANKTDYLVLSTNDPLTYNPASDFTANNLYGLAPEFKIVGNQLFVNYPATYYAGGPVLQNSAPVNTPFFADFVVSGNVKTGNTSESNTIRNLIFQPGSTLQVYNTLQVTDGRFTVNGGTGTLNGGQIFVPGTFTKAGGGSLIVNSNVQVNGATFIDGGHLAINGAFYSGLGFNVGPNGSLGGIGQLLGDLKNNGTVAPGNSIGTLNVSGDYIQSSGGTLAMEVRNASINDRINITGAAILAGTLALDFISNELSFGDVVTFLTAQGGISGQFDQITGVPSGFRARPWLVNNSQVYNVIFAPQSYTQVAQGTNQLALARALDRWIGDTDPVIAAATLKLDLLRAETYPLVFEAVLPTIYGTLTATTFTDSFSDGRTANQQVLFARQRLQALNAQSPEHSAGEVSTSEGSEPSTSDTPAPSTDNHGWRVWADARGGYSDDDPLNLDSEGGTILAGADVILAKNWIAGLYVGGQSRESTGSSPDYNADGPRFGTYGLFTFAEHAYVSGVLGGGTSDVSVTRPLPFGQSASGDTDGFDWFARLETGYTFTPGGVNLTPFAGVQYSRAAYDGFSESSDSVFALSIEDWASDRFEGFIGGDVSYPIPTGNQYVLLPYARLMLRDTFDQTDDELNSSLLGGSGPGFGFSPETINGDGFEYGIGVRFSATETGWSLNLGYTGFSGDDSDSEQVNLGFSWDL